VGTRRRDNRDGTQIYIMAMALVFIVLAPLAAKAMQFAISRRREALADVSGVLITRNPEGLISALEKLRDNPAVIAHAPAATAHLWIESPLDPRSHGAHGWFNRLFETHPTVGDAHRRVARSRRSDAGATAMNNDRELEMTQPAASTRTAQRRGAHERTMDRQLSSAHAGPPNPSGVSRQTPARCRSRPIVPSTTAAVSSSTLVSSRRASRITSPWFITMWRSQTLKA